MNDETKKLLFFNSDFLDQAQLNNVVNKTKSLIRKKSTFRMESLILAKYLFLI